MPKKGRRQLPILHTFEICDKVKIEDGKRTLSGIFQVLNVIMLPTKHRQFSVVLGFSRGKGRFSGRLVVKSPSKREIVALTFRLEMKNADDTSYHIIELNDMPILEIGRHNIIVYLDDEKIREREIIIHMEEVKEFSEEEIEKLLLEPDVIKKARAILKCPRCNKEYSFQLNLDPKQPLDEGARPFPPDNKFRCPNDDFETDLTGIKFSLKRILGRPPPKKSEGE